MEKNGYTKTGGHQQWTFIVWTKQRKKCIMETFSLSHFARQRDSTVREVC